jgi:putative oxidoreductase
MVAIGLLVLRVVIGLTMAGHGAQKLFGWWGGAGINGWTAGMTRMRIRPALFWAWTSALAELGGGLLLALGLLTPLACAAIAAAMLVAVALVHWPKGFWNSKGGYEFNLSIVAAIVALAFTGPGPISLDAALGIRFPEPATLIVLVVLVLAGVGVALFTRAPATAVEGKPQTT